MSGAIGVNALYFLFVWLISAAAASWLSERKGYGERVGLTFGLILSVLGLLIVLLLPGRPGSKWRVDGSAAATAAPAVAALLTDCGPFADYRPGPHSVFMTRALQSARPMVTVRGIRVVQGRVARENPHGKSRKPEITRSREPRRGPRPGSGRGRRGSCSGRRRAAVRTGGAGRAS